MNDLVRAGQKSLANTSDESLTNSAGNAMLYSGGGVLALGAAAAILPVITLPMLVPVAIAGGIYLKVKANKG